MAYIQVTNVNGVRNLFLQNMQIWFGNGIADNFSHRNCMCRYAVLCRIVLVAVCITIYTGVEYK
jgi:hypothetical protein